jgi:hypothetical protein
MSCLTATQRDDHEIDSGIYYNDPFKKKGKGFYSPGARGASLILHMVRRFSCLLSELSRSDMGMRVVALLSFI